MRDARFSRRPPRGVSLIELLMAMGGVSLVITSSAMLLHGVMRAQSESRRFFDDERTSARLARQFRADVHAAERISSAAGGTLANLEFPGGESVEYRHSADRRRIERRLLAPGNLVPTAREDFCFAGSCAAVVTVADRRIALEIGPDNVDGSLVSPGTVPPPRSLSEARRKPPALVVEAALGRDLRFLPPRDGEERP